MQTEPRAPPLETDVERLAFGISYLYLLRVPLLLWLALLTLPIVAVPEGARFEALLRGLFDIVDRNATVAVKIVAFALVSVSSLMATAAIVLPARLILCDGQERFGGRSVPR